MPPDDQGKLLEAAERVLNIADKLKLLICGAIVTIVAAALWANSMMFGISDLKKENVNLLAEVEKLKKQQTDWETAAVDRRTLRLHWQDGVAYDLGLLADKAGVKIITRP